MEFENLVKTCGEIVADKSPGVAHVENLVKPTNPNGHTYVNGTDVETHGFAVTHNTLVQ